MSNGNNSLGHATTITSAAGFSLLRSHFPEWYSASSPSIYFGVLFHQSLNLVHFKIVIEPDLNSITVNVAKTFQIRSGQETQNILAHRYRTCEDTLFSWERANSTYQDPSTCIVYIQSMSPSDTSSLERPILLYLPHPVSGLGFPSSCPASGRFILQDTSRMAVIDYL